MTIGVLALQGDYDAHRKLICDAPDVARVIEVRDVETLNQCDGLIIPGGESTTMSRLCDRYDLWQPLQEKLQNGMGAFGTCAGLIMLSQRIEGASKNFAQKTLRVLDVDVARNAYGAQLDSFECELNWEAGDWRLEAGDAAQRLNTQSPVSNLQPLPMHAIFIRAPRITRVGAGVKVLARHNGEAVAVRQGKIVACAFHPEIVGEDALHRFWLESLQQNLGEESNVEREKEAI